ncbi:MAG: LuxR C-terminal-related transcriptional regulator [Planctomycetota bacterium]|nr:LuxR C-terminal-related transcriptional regulator [Planctomycetota bacterium]
MRWARFRPADLVWFDDGPRTRTLVVDASGQVLTGRMPRVGTIAATPGGAPGPQLRELLGDLPARERFAILRRVMDSGESQAFFELLDGVRQRTRIFAAEPGSFTGIDRAALMVSRPDVHEVADGSPRLPTLATATFGTLEVLSSRELEVLRLIVRFGSTKAVALHLSRSGKTVENQIQSMHRKLNVSTRAELVRVACDAGLLAFSDHEWSSILASRGNERI